MRFGCHKEDAPLAGHLRKPFDRQTVLDAIERAIQVERAAGPTVAMASGHGKGIA